jgi:hypothetical protein
MEVTDCLIAIYMARIPASLYNQTCLPLLRAVVRTSKPQALMMMMFITPGGINAFPSAPCTRYRLVST